MLASVCFLWSNRIVCVLFARLAVSLLGCLFAGSCVCLLVCIIVYLAGSCVCLFVWFGLVCLVWFVWFGLFGLVWFGLVCLVWFVSLT